MDRDRRRRTSERQIEARVQEDIWMAERHVAGCARGLPPRANVAASLRSKYVVYPELRGAVARGLSLLGEDVPDVAPRAIALVGCGKAKGSAPAPARELYTGALFRASFAYAAARYENVAIVSARYGLVVPWRVLAPYDLAIAELGEAAKEVWAKDVVGQISVLVGFSLPYRVTLLMGDAYAAPLRANLTRELRCLGVREPVRGLPLGARLQWFAKARARRGERDGGARTASLAMVPLS